MATITPHADRRVLALPRYFHEYSDADWVGRHPSVDSRRELAYDEFIAEYVARKRPVIIKDAIPRDAITPAVVRSLYGSKLLTELVTGGSTVLARGRASAIDKYADLVTVGDYMDRFETSNDLPYLTNLSMCADFPGLRDRCPVPTYFKPNWRMTFPLSIVGPESRHRLKGDLFFGPRGASYGVLHYDMYGVYIGTCQYYGKKAWWLYPPEQSQYLYPTPVEYPYLSPVDPFNPNPERYPLFAHAQPTVAVLEAGDIMFIPGGWWHITNAVTPNISSNIRIVNRHNLAPHLRDFVSHLVREPRQVGQMVSRMRATS